MAAGVKTDRRTLPTVIALSSKLIGYLLTPNERNNFLPLYTFIENNYSVENRK